MSESYLDRPQDDGTHKAHPAYNRGKVAGVKAVLHIIKDIVWDVDTGDGKNKSPQVEAVRRALLEYKQVLRESNSKASDEALDKAKKLVAGVRI